MGPRKGRHIVAAALYLSYLNEEERPFDIHGESLIKFGLCRALQILGTKVIIRSSVGKKVEGGGERERAREQGRRGEERVLGSEIELPSTVKHPRLR